MPEFHFTELGYKSCTCHFCQKRIPFDSAVSYRGTGSIDDLGCWICRVPVCDECGFSTWLSEDPSFRFRLCSACRNGNPGFDPFARRKDPKHFRYCQECETLSDSGIALCKSCKRLVCPTCAKTVEGESLCPNCYAREEAKSFLCPGCKKRRYYFQHEGSAPSRKCRGCGIDFCHSCLSVLGKAKGQIDRLCPQCGELYGIENDSEDVSPDEPGAADGHGVMKKIWTLVTGLVAPMNPGNRKPEADPPAPPAAFGKNQTASKIPYASFQEFERLRAVMQRDDLPGFRQFSSLPGRDPAGNTPLHLACHFGASQIVDDLLSKRVNIEALNCPENETPLFTAIRAGQEDLARRLLQHKANPEHRNARNESPFYLAIGFKLKTLVREIAAIPYLNYSPARDGRNALDFARQTHDPEYPFHVLEAILENLERNPISDSNGFISEGRGNKTVDPHFHHIRTMFDKHRDLWIRYIAEDRYRDLPDRGFFLAYILLRLIRVGNDLDQAIRRLIPSMAPTSSRPYENQWWAVLKLADLGWDVNTRNREGNTILHLVLQPRSCWTPTPEFLLSVTAPLLARKADIHLMNLEGKTPQELARQAGIDLRDKRHER